MLPGTDGVMGEAFSDSNEEFEKFQQGSVGLW
jgi:hypothetical protein